MMLILYSLTVCIILDLSKLRYQSSRTHKTESTEVNFCLRMRTGTKYGDFSMKLWGRLKSSCKVLHVLAVFAQKGRFFAHKKVIYLRS